MEMWQSSKHGQLFASEETRDQAPTCVTCHMPKGTHNTSLGLTFGNVSSGAILEGERNPVKMRTITKSESKLQRRKMVETCLPCHSSRFAAESLEAADAVKKEADELLFNAVEIISDLQKEGLLRRSRSNLLGNAEVPFHALALGSDQLYEGLSEIEERYYNLFKFHHASTFKGAYHHSPEYTHNQGFLKMKQDLTFIENAAVRLREAAKESTLKSKEQQ